MSLKTFLERPDVRRRFSESSVLPKWPSDIEPKVRPEGSNPSLVGVAFDYLLRTFIRRITPSARTSHWRALRANCSNMEDLDKGMGFIEEARGLEARYLEDGAVSDEMLDAYLRLAQVEILYRSRKLPLEFGSVKEADREDLRGLSGLIDPNLFRTQSRCLLNPDFGIASTRIGGADADLILDSKLIEIKTVKRLKTRETVHQLVGYYLLAHIGGIDGRPDPGIEQLGVYLSRSGALLTVAVAEVLSQEAFHGLCRWMEGNLRN